MFKDGQAFSHRSRQNRDRRPRVPASTDNTAPLFIPPREIEFNLIVNVIVKHGSLSSVELSSAILDIGVCYTYRTFA